MKPKKESTTSVVRNKYTAQFKEQALERADRDGIPKVAQDLELAESMLYSWWSKRRQTGQPFEEQKLQQAELTRLKRENARLKEEETPKSSAWTDICPCNICIHHIHVYYAGGVADKYAMIKDNEEKCITIANAFTPNWAMLAQKPLKLKKSLSSVSVK
jgi:transposase